MNKGLKLNSARLMSFHAKVIKRNTDLMNKGLKLKQQLKVI